jgi:hypothetical protein
MFVSLSIAFGMYHMLPHQSPTRYCGSPLQILCTVAAEYVCGWWPLNKSEEARDWKETVYWFVCQTADYCSCFGRLRCFFFRAWSMIKDLYTHTHSLFYTHIHLLTHTHAHSLSHCLTLTFTFSCSSEDSFPMQIILCTHSNQLLC